MICIISKKKLYFTPGNYECPNIKSFVKAKENCTYLLYLEKATDYFSIPFKYFVTYGCVQKCFQNFYLSLFLLQP